MANEYGEIEQLVNDVTSLDTARMTLRWALERLNSIEKEKAELKKNLTLTEETARSLQIKEASLRESFESRHKTLAEKEDFYTKLEATMALLGEGKLDVQQLLKKEAKLDILRKNLEAEYQDKFEELDHNQRAVIGRWNARLLETESQYAGRLAEAQKKYDALRAELEGDFQRRLTALQSSFSGREAELNARIAALETAAKEREGKTEARRAELEAQYLAQQREAETNYRKLKTMLEAGLEDKLRAMDSDHAAQVRSLEESWQIERSRLLDEQRLRDAQFSAAQARIKEIENNLAGQQESHHAELLKIITETEAAFHAQLLELEKEKKAKENRVRELMVQLETRNSGWEGERARLEEEYGARLSAIEASARERTADLERDYALKKEELNAALAAGRAGFEREFQSRLEIERRALAGEKEALAGEKALREAALAAAEKNIRELEAALAASNEEHHRETLERISSGEKDFREKLVSFETEKTSYQKTIAGMADELRARETILAEEKNKLACEYEAKLASYENRARQSEAAFDEQRKAYNKKLDEFSALLTKAAETALIERETFKSEIARVAVEAQALAEKRIAAIRVDYDTRKVELEKEFVARYGDRLRAIEAEKERMNEALCERDEQLKAAYAKVSATDTEMTELRKSATEAQHGLAIEYDVKLRTALKEAGVQAAAREAELTAGINALHCELEQQRRLLAGEKERLITELEKAAAAARLKSGERVEAVRAEYEARLEALTAAAETRLAEVKDLLAQKEAQAEIAAAERARAEKSIKAAFDLEKAGHIAEKEALAADFERRLSQAETGFSERVGIVRADYENRKAELEKEFSARYADRLKGLEAERERMREVLAGREAEVMELLAQKKTQAELAAVERVEAEAAAKSAFDQETARHRAEKEALAADFERRLSQSEAGMAAGVSAARAEYENRKAELEQEYALRKAELENKFNDRTAAWRASHEADYRSREEVWALERNRLMDAVAARDEQLKSGQQKIRVLQGELETQFAAMETAAEEKYSRLEREFEQFKQTRIKDLEDSWANQRAGFINELSKRDALVQRISEEMLSLREGLAQAAAEKAQNAEEVIHLRAQDAKMREKCAKLDEAMESLREAVRLEKDAWQKNTEKKNKALKDEWEHEKAGQILYYQEKMDKLVEACEKYNKEIEAREEAVRLKEKK